jgi:hypothetical protein
VGGTVINVMAFGGLNKHSAIHHTLCGVKINARAGYNAFISGM